MTRGLELVASSLLALVTLGSTGATSAFKTVDILKDGYEDYKSEGCYVDSKRNRIMSERVVAEPMSAEICFELCNQGRYTHFGTQHGDECWCAKDPWLTANGDKVSSSQCDTRCKRSDTKEKCGGNDRISVYKMLPEDHKDDKDNDGKDDKDDDGKDDKDDDGKDDKDDDGKDDKDDDGKDDKDDDGKDGKDDDGKDGKDDDGKDDKDDDGKDDKDDDGKDDKDDDGKDGKDYELYKSKGCYKDDSSNRIMSKKHTRRSMSAEICYHICEERDYTHFGTQYGEECWCGKNPHLMANGGKLPSSECDMSCARSDTREKCGGRDRMSVYELTKHDDKDDDHKDDDHKDDDHKDDDHKDDDHKDDDHKDDDHKDDDHKDDDHKDDDHKDDDQKDDDHKDDDHKDDEDDDHKDDKDKPYESEGCYKDSGRNRIMSKMYTREPMSAEICYAICDDRDYTHFGTQYGKECWCAEDPHLSANGGRVSSGECDMHCAGARAGEKCGGRDRMSVYKMKGRRDDDGHDDDKTPPYKGCYADKKSRRAMPGEKWESNSMTIKMCVGSCSDLGYKYAGVEYGKECWCSDKYDAYGASTRCSIPCAGNDREACGGRDALSVYEC